MAVKRKNWSREELIIALNLYCRTPFGRINKSYLDIIDIAKKLGRTPSAVSMKMCNFARFDPQLQKRNVKGLEHGSKQDKKYGMHLTGIGEILHLKAKEYYTNLDINWKKGKVYDPT